jgi:hypothetical protein
MMTKKLSITIKADRPKSRNHKVLFVTDTPFKSKIVKLKTVYKRRPKYLGKSSID